MSQQQDDLRDAFEQAGYEVGEITTNRKQLRVILHEEGAESDKLRDVVNDVYGEDGVLGLNVTTESVEGQDAVQTVVSFRARA